MKILVLDNYDSFTYNLVHLLRELGHNPAIVRNDKMEVAQVAAYDKILLSPGPGVPDEAGIMKSVIREYAPSKSILGVCLGHQGIAEVFGATLFNLPTVLHGVTSTIEVKTEAGIFKGVPTNFRATHYHSWAVNPSGLPDVLEITASNEHGHIMAIRHKKMDVQGVQFHPESVMTEFGKEMLGNWLNG